MNDRNPGRTDAWQPHERPDWVRRINEEGSYMDIKSVVPLDENSLIERAKANTGLSDFGEEDWREAFQILIKGLDEDAQLNLVGRLMTRSDLLLYLQARLRIEDTFKRHPEIHEEEIRSPLFILGQGRSGTTALHNLLSTDPDNGSLREWNVMAPCPPPEKATFHTDPRIEKLNPLCTQMNRVAPENESMHEHHASMPTEQIHLHSLTFKSVWLTAFCGQTSTYTEYLMKQPMVPVFEYEKKVLKLLQWKNPNKRWVLKSPAAIGNIPELIEVYPDIRFIWAHRDPIQSLASMVNIVGTLFWTRSDHPFSGSSLDTVTKLEQSARQLTQPIEWLESGVLPRAQLCNVHFKDIVADSLGVASKIYDYYGIEMPKESRQAMHQFLVDKPRSKRPAHEYDVHKGGDLSRERRAYERYQNYFNVPSEV